MTVNTTGLFPDIMLIAGSVLFLIAAFLPISRVYVESVPAIRLQIIQDRRTQWNISQILFAIGALAVAVALFLGQRGFRELTRSTLGWIGVGLILFGAILWSIHVYYRATAPEAWLRGDFPNLGRFFVLYSLFTQIGLLLIGIMLRHSLLANWVSLMLIIAPALLFFLMVMFRDMPPFVYYVLTLITAVMFLVQ